MKRIALREGIGLKRKVTTYYHVPSNRKWLDSSAIIHILNSMHEFLVTWSLSGEKVYRNEESTKI